ncbi:proton-coupled amino acid transporter-like protein pathetic [Nasonia vitripennis]|uniref:Amino acid transporter transmembrane domain-containing protein n=1 Tax=Nasonia vitripennis TaxID=7425 RepID=A0A7M7QSQ7_NASVI|nr:proton-coupled amino acid transporter-like protein pathetic [Nasonia vitripennis]XP_032453954.1 proton-coupled amino acid transporter-like protein pathetic [Nasonia vitripennis]
MGKKEEANEAPGEQMRDFSSTTKIAPVIGQYHEKDELYDPFDHRDKKHTTSDVGSATHLIKSSLGTGILAMPSAIKNGGLLVGGIGTIIIGILCSHCVHILVRSSHVLCRRTKTPQMTYAETAGAAFESGPLAVRKYAAFAKNLVNWALCATYVGGACVYIVFIADAIKVLGDEYSGIDIPKRTYMLCLIPAVVLLGQIRHLKILVPFSVIANMSLTIGFSITLYYIFSDLKPLSEIHYVSTWAQMPKFFATVIFAIEGIGTVMPIENSMANPNHFIGCPGVLNISMTVVISLYTMMGVFGYLSFGDDAKGSITLNLPPGDILAQVVNILIALAVILTYGLQFFVPLEIIWNSIKHKFSHRWEVLGETVMRILMVLLTVSVAMLVPRLEPFISLVGAIFFSFLGIFIPAVVETVSCWECHLGTCNWRLWKNCFLALVAVCALISGTWISLLDIISLYTTPASGLVDSGNKTIVNAAVQTILSTTLGVINSTTTLSPVDLTTTVSPVDVITTLLP